MAFTAITWKEMEASFFDEKADKSLCTNKEIMRSTVISLNESNKSGFESGLFNVNL